MPLNNISLTRFPNGVTNQAENTIFGGALPFPYWTNYRVFDEDFYEYIAAQWTVTETQAGATQGLVDGNGGVLSLVNSAADNDLNAIQRIAAGVSAESWQLDPVKKLFMRCRVNVNNITLSDMIMGLQITDTTPLAVSDGLFFRKSEGAATVNMVAVKDSVEATLALGSIVIAPTFTDLDLYWDGGGVANGRLYGALNGTIAGFIQPGVSFPDDEPLTVSLAVQNGSAAARTMQIDRVLIIQEV